MAPLGPTLWLRPLVCSVDWYKGTAHGFFCPLCSSGAAADAWHILNVCSHPAVAAARVPARVSLADLLARIALLAATAQTLNSLPAGRVRARAAALDVAAFSPSLNWDTPVGLFLAYRLCLAMPFPESCIAANERLGCSAAALGRLLDSVCVRDHALRALADAWVTGGARILDTIGGCWRDAVNASGAPPRTPPPALSHFR